MSNVELTPEVKRRLRGLILKLLCARHDEQQSRMDDVELTSAVQSFAYHVVTPHIVTLLQDLQDRGYVRFHQGRDFLTRRVRLEKIELTAKGRDQVEGNVDASELDPAVEL